MGNADSLLQAEGLSRDYEHYTAVQDYQLTLKRGEILGLLGPNGAGKSTTLRMLSGTLAPSRGSIRIKGIDLLEQPRRAKQSLGYLPDQPPLYFDLTVEEYLGYCGRLRGIRKAEVAAAIQHVINTCSLEEVKQRLISHLSLGYQQRVGIAQAIIHEPDLVILDEPTKGLDPIQINAIRDLIRNLAEQHAVILSTHILSEVEAVCNRVQIINQGQIVHESQLGTQEPDKLFFQLHLAKPPETVQIEALQGVESVITQDNGRYLISVGDAQASLQAVANAAVQNDWGLLGLCPQHESLEQTFMQKVFQEDRP
jgi:ABC-2 type transport system ATP-binding protein